MKKWIPVGIVVVVLIFFGVFWGKFKESTSRDSSSQVAPSYTVDDPGQAPSPTTTGPVPTTADDPMVAIPTPLAFNVDRSNPDAVLVAVLETISNVDTSKLYNPNYAAMLAKPLLSNQYYKELVSTGYDVAPSSQWRQWSAQGVVLNAAPPRQLFEGGAPPDAQGSVSRMYQVKQTPITSDGTPLPEVTSYIKARLALISDGWVVVTLVSSN